MNASRKPIIFMGPTLLRAKAREIAEADFRPPATMGAITRAACDKPSAIILIDGNFEDRPSVWHKEILWAMSQGIPVIGASSMGAIRASELDTLGMLGVGAVYEAFASGRLQDDDEVAVLHGPEEANWIPVSDAMADIRDAVYEALRLGIIDESEAGRLIFFCKAQFFKHRSLAEALGSILPLRRNSHDVRSIVKWFLSPRVGLKERDCRSLLANLQINIHRAMAQLDAAPVFVPTVYLSRLQPFGFSHAE